MSSFIFSEEYILDSSLKYNDKFVRQFAIATVVWGVIGMAAGVWIAAQLAWPALNFDIPWLSYGRLRPLHMNAVIFALGICGLFATSFYVVQRTCQVRLFSDKLAAFTFWGWQAVLVSAAVTLPMGLTRGKEYAELEWPITILTGTGADPLARGRGGQAARLAPGQELELGTAVGTFHRGRQLAEMRLSYLINMQ
jgi:cbb3-type cytochrome oxidase subunit 1